MELWLSNVLIFTILAIVLKLFIDKSKSDNKLMYFFTVIGTSLGLGIVVASIITFILILIGAN